VSCGLGADSVALAGRLAGGAEHAADGRPGHARFAGSGDGLGDASLGGGAFGHGIAERMQWRCVADVGRIVVREPALERVGVLEDLLQAAGHGHHLKYFRRAVIAWTMTGPWSVSMNPSSIRWAERVGPMIITSPSSRSS